MKKLLFFVSVLFAGPAFSQLSNVIPPSGSVGIGTSNPDPNYQLTINGSAKALSAFEANSDLRVNGQTVLNNIVRMHGLSPYAGSAAGMEVLVTDASGNITRTTVRGLIGASMDPSTINCGGSVDSPSWYNGLNKLYSPCPEVNVGIGNSSPQFKLDVTGITYAYSFKAGNKLATSNAIISGFASNNTQDLFSLGTKVGSGSEEITFKVANDGTVYSREINVRIPSSFPDYVFDENYKLYSFEDLRKFIEKNHHLPNIPSANEVEENGLKVGEFQYKIVEKVEELTLYSLDLDQRNLQLKKENKELKEQLAILQKEINAIKESINHSK